MLYNYTKSCTCTYPVFEYFDILQNFSLFRVKLRVFDQLTYIHDLYGICFETMLYKSSVKVSKFAEGNEIVIRIADKVYQVS